ncbi:DNA cytosine methyltransferase [Glycomyces sp. A-F 0318]|uniref:DNA cytosine methyltransferase n=1 Tax=Glycomyces amatae TaxID=2881355 RepID=UPI001E31C697|nr:DNA cytosine methyltransferase [Glycomyces amatae]MCD0447502.1 DNA cytosine methyltransferase [Glycomyces amatae]
MRSPATGYGHTPAAPAPLRLGSLCTGYGGLDIAVEHVLGARMDWCAENDAYAAKVVAAHWSSVPNFGDLRTVDWRCTPPVDIVCAGFPCQPVSNAGHRKGAADDRWLWPHIADALRWIRPRYVVLENVAAIVNRGMDAVLGSLAALGFDAVWGCYRASWAGAPHRRDRWFLLGWRHEAPADAAGFGGRGPAVPAHPESGSRSARQEPSGRGVLAAPAADAAGAAGYGNGGAPTGCGLPPVPVRSPPPRETDVDWGAYGPAIARWEHMTGRAAPYPTIRTERGLRSSTQFVEWMQGLSGGWVTGRGLPRIAELRLLGNGVVPQQASMALWDLKTHIPPPCCPQRPLVP